MVSYGFFKLDTWESSRNDSRCCLPLFCRCKLQFSPDASPEFCRMDEHKHGRTSVCRLFSGRLLCRCSNKSKEGARGMRFTRRKGVIPEKEWKPFSLQGKAYSDEYQPARHLRMNALGFVVSVNPSFAEALCPFKEKRVIERLVKDTSGKYFVIIEGVNGEGICQKKDIVQ